MNADSSVKYFSASCGPVDLPPAGCLGDLVLGDLVQVVGDDAALGLRQPEHAAKLSRLAGLAFADNGGMRLKHAHQLLAGGHRLALKDSTDGLGDDLFETWHEGLQGLLKPLSQTIRVLLE